MANSDELYQFSSDNGQIVATKIDLISGERESLSSVMPSTTYNCSFTSGAVIGSRIYFCGGKRDDHVVNNLIVYDTLTNSWDELSPMPQGVDTPIVAALGDSLYVAGGWSVGNGVLSSVYRYDTKTDQWSVLKDMNHEHNNHQLIGLNGRLYAICGYSTKTVEEYNPATGEWRSVASANFGHYGGAAQTSGGKIYVNSHEGFEEYSPQTDTWKVLPSLPVGPFDCLLPLNGKLRASCQAPYPDRTVTGYEFDISGGQWKELKDVKVDNHCAAVYVVRRPLSRQYLYCFGGWDETDVYIDSVSRLDLTSGLWEACEPLSARKASFGAVSIGTKVYICGGERDDVDEESSTIMDTLEVYDCQDNTSTMFRPLPEGRAYAPAALLNGMIYVSGGQNPINRILSSVVRYCPETDLWEKVSPMLTARVGHRMLELNGYLYAIGGFKDPDYLNSVERYDPGKDQWEMVAPTGFKHYRFGAIASRGHLYVCNHEGFEVYSPESDSWRTLRYTDDQYYGRELVEVSGKLWSVGGGGGWGKDIPTGGQKTIQVFDEDVEDAENTDDRKGKWNQLPEMDVARENHFAIVVNIVEK